MSSDSSNLIVNYLPPSFREIELQTLFAPYGEIIHTKVVFRKDTAESLTYGFVKFERSEDASAALNALNGLEICGKKIKVSYARPSDPEIKNSKIFITRLPKSYSIDDVRELFNDCGEIIESRLLVDNDGNSRQLAFIQFSNHAEAELAIKRFSGTVPPRGDQNLVIKYAIQPKALPPSISSHHSSEDFEQYSNSSQDNNIIISAAPAPTPIVNQMKNRDRSNNRQHSHSRHSPHHHTMIPPPSQISPVPPIQWSSQNIPSPYWPPPPPPPPSSHSRYEQYIPQPPPSTSSYPSGPQIQQPEHYSTSSNPNSQPPPPHHHHHHHHSNYLHPLHYNPHSHPHPPPPTVAVPQPQPPPSTSTSSSSSNNSNISPTSPVVIGIIISPVPHSVDVLSFPFLRDYGVIIEGKLEPLPQNQPHNSSIDSHPRSNMSSPHPSFTLHRLVYQIRVDSPERAQSLVRFHGTTLQLNGYFMTLEIQSL